MVTWTFDAMALFVGILIGVVLGGCVICFVMLKDGSWDRGFSEGWNEKHDYLTWQAKEEKHDTDTERIS